jgi:hypothetical protein
MCSLNLRIDSKTLFVSLIKALGCGDIPLVLAHSRGCAQAHSEHAASRGRAGADLLGELNETLFKSLRGPVALQLAALACRQKKDEHPTRHQSSRTAAYTITAVHAAAFVGIRVDERAARREDGVSLHQPS